MKRRMILSVRMRDGKWIIKASKCIDGWTVDDSPKSYAQAVDLAFAYAKKTKGAIVRLCDEKNGGTTDIDPIGVRNYVPAKRKKK